MSPLYEYPVVTENSATRDFALTKAKAYCVCETGTSDTDANSSTVCMDHRKCGLGNYTIVPGNNTLNP